MDFLTRELINIKGISLALWHVLVAVAVLVLLVIVIVAICRASSRRKKAKKLATQTTEVADEPIVTDETVTDEPVEEVDDDEPADEVIVTIDEEVDEDEVAEPTAEVTTEPVAETPVVEESSPEVEQPTEQPEEPTAEPVAKKPTVKNYHISLRPDGKWQVKLSKGGKAIKLFDTQVEAIAFAKARAKSQDGHITIHKVDGKIRKQKY